MNLRKDHLQTTDWKVEHYQSAVRANIVQPLPTEMLDRHGVFVVGMCFSCLQLSAWDALARMMMKGAVKCGKHLEEQQSVSKQMSEPGLSSQGFSDCIPASELRFLTHWPALSSFLSKHIWF